MNDSIPVRHSASAIRRYMKFFLSVKQNHPNVITVDPEPLSSETFACRFRDAVQGVIAYNALPEARKIVESWAHDFMVASVPGTNQLYIGARASVRAKLKADKQIGSVVNATVGEIDVLDESTTEIINAVVTLVGHNIIPHAVFNNTPVKLIEAACKGAPRPIEVIEQGGAVTIL